MTCPQAPLKLRPYGAIEILLLLICVSQISNISVATAKANTYCKYLDIMMATTYKLYGRLLLVSLNTAPAARYSIRFRHRVSISDKRRYGLSICDEARLLPSTIQMLTLATVEVI